MKFFYHMIAAMLFAVLAWPTQATAQEFTDCPDTEDVCVVEWGTDVGEPIVNALRNTIANDDPRPEGRVYVLKRGGFYYNQDHISYTDFHLSLIGQTAEEGEAAGENVCGDGTEDCGPAIIQRVPYEDGTVNGLMIESNGDSNSGLTIRNAWIMGMDLTGTATAYEPITINSSNSVLEFENVVFDRNAWHHLGVKGTNNDVYIRDSNFRNLTITDQIWGGRGIRFEAGADSVVFENNTFLNLTSFPFQSEAAPVEYFLFNHNTLVNFGRNFNAGGLWQEAYVTNNIMVNPFWQGESEAQYQDRLDGWIADGNDPDDLDPWTGVFSVAALPSQYGLELDRRIVLANNAMWRDPDLESYYGTLNITAQPLVSDSTQSFFDLYDGMAMEGNLAANPGFETAPLTADVYAQMGTFLEQWVTEAATPWELVYWDPNRPPVGDELHPVSIAWPLSEDLSYSNADYLTAGTDELPLGDLNWFPVNKDTYLANREQYVQEVQDLAGAPPEPPAGTNVIQAENASSLDGATVESVEGFTSFFMEGAGSITWTFDVPADGEYGLNLMTNMRQETTRGQHVRVDGTGLRNASNYGEYFFCSVAATDEQCTMALAQDTWETIEIRESSLIPDVAGSLTLTAGTHTLEIAPSWGYQAFSTVEVVDATGNVIATLTPPEATAVGVAEECEEGGFCPSGFQWVEVGAGQSATLNVDVPAGINSALLRIFYRSEGGAMGSVSLNDTEVGMIDFAVNAGDASTEVSTDKFPVTEGTHTLTVASNSGSVQLDYVLMLTYEGSVSGVEESELPDGWALDQNYPNPFNPVTTIRYELASAGDITIVVYDVLGRQVTTLFDGNHPAGQHQIRFDASTLTSGVYFYRMKTPVGQQVRKMMVLK